MREQWIPGALLPNYQERLGTRLLHHQGEFQHKNCTLGSLNDSDHDVVGRFFVGHSQGSVRLIIYIIYFTLRGTIFPIPGV